MANGVNISVEKLLAGFSAVLLAGAATLATTAYFRIDDRLQKIDAKLTTGAVADAQHGAVLDAIKEDLERIERRSIGGETGPVRLAVDDHEHGPDADHSHLTTEPE